MNTPIPLASVADAAHSLALELYRLTARWPECERDGLTLEVRRVGRELSGTLNEVNGGARSRSLRRVIGAARAKHARLAYLIRFATDMGYRKLSTSNKVDAMMTNLDVELDLLVWEAWSDRDSIMPDGLRRASASRPGVRATPGKHHDQQGSRYRREPP